MPKYCVNLFTFQEEACVTHFKYKLSSGSRGIDWYVMTYNSCLYVPGNLEKTLKENDLIFYWLELCVEDIC